MRRSIPATMREDGWIGRLATALAALAALAVILWGAQRMAIDAAIARERERLTGVATLAATNFRRQVDTFQLVATTLSADPEVRRVLDGRDADAANRLNARLATLSATLDTSVIYLMDSAGTTVVSSNWRQPDSFLGENYRFRTYFTRAMATGGSSQFALGTRSRIPGLFLARRIDGSRGATGVLVVKIRFDRLEREWAQSIGDAFVADVDGVILVSSDPALRFRTVVPVSAERRAALRAQQLYGDAPLSLHTAFAARDVLTQDRWHGERLLAVTVPAAGGRNLTVMAPIAGPAFAARNLALLLVGLVAITLIAGGLGITARRRLLHARANEAEQRRANDLKARLEQANRLSSLGQVAAGVGHEINQPIAAIGMRAGSAARLIEAGRATEAQAALAEIDSLVGRVGAITGELRQFSRRSERTLGPVRLADVLGGLSLLMGDTLRRKNAFLAIAIEPEDLCVLAEQVRLEQVLVNLVQNALDAGGDGTHIAIAASPQADRVRITVSDDGPGIADDMRAALFQPFTTSKPDGLGLGLVISRDIVAELGGELVLVTPPGSGAVFAINLARVA